MNILFYLIVFLSSHLFIANTDQSEKLVQDCAWKIGEKLWELSKNITNHAELKQEYSNLNVSELNSREIIAEITNQMKNMLDLKKYALRRIVNTAEECTKNLSDAPTKEEIEHFTFVKSAKNLTAEEEKLLKPNVNFFNSIVSTNFSTIHLPDDVFEGSNETLLGIKWSEVLDSIFQHNYAIDPTLSWQYFAGSSGFMRIYPGVKWEYPEDESGEDPKDKADLYDARSRPWYIEAASDPKDLVILVDTSGSMMGKKGEIARHTINIILETLGPNDFVNIIRFNDKPSPVGECFNYNLVQANLVTIRELKKGVEGIDDSSNIANFSSALIEAFEVLENHRKEHLASMCNQAIMLITDGVPDSHINIFQMYNWGNYTDSPKFPVRVFTYLIGRDGADFRETKWMACANRGFYVQLNTIPEVKEQVFNYLNVLARPLVLKRSKKIAWTSLYAHRMDPKITDRYWEKEQDNLQKEYSLRYRDNWATFLQPIEQLKRFKERKKLEWEQNKNFGFQKYNFMITISHPAYDKRTKKNITENILVNEAYWTQRVYEAEIASLLGVAATDIPISEFRKIMRPYYLGVCNYGFIVNNNGYVITHPDLRPVFRETLKPGYNSVDMLEVELLDSEPHKEIRDFGIHADRDVKTGEAIYSLSNLSLLRDYIINQTEYTNYYAVKYHYDNMRRASTGIRNYYVRKIDDSPFTMVLAIMKQPCKSHSHCPGARVVVPHFDEKMSRERIQELFSGNWNIHPDWFYCKYNYKNDYYEPWSDNVITNKTTELLHFLKKMIDDSFLKESRNPYADLTEEEKYIGKERSECNSTKKEGNFELSYFCDKELIRNVIYDANITRNAFHHLRAGVVPTDLQIDIANAFVATHGGLTRWKDIGNPTNFGLQYNRAIDEIWYKRAVEQHYVEEKSFVFSVPVEEETKEPKLVTASHAIFVKEKKKNKADGYLEAPVAVVGYQFNHTHFEQFVRNVVDETSRTSYEMDYAILDNNAYIIAGSDKGYSGKFFGKIQSRMMKQFKECKIYKQIIIYDYQGICFQPVHPNSAVSLFINPLRHAQRFVMWTVGTLIWGIVQIHIEMMMSGIPSLFKCEDEDAPYVIDKRDQKLLSSFQVFNSSPEDDAPKYSFVKHVVMLNRTRPQTCDRKVTLYQLEPEVKWDRKSSNCSEIISSVKIIPHTNLLFVHLKNGFEELDDDVDVSYFSTDPLEIETKYLDSTYNSPVCYKVNAVLSRRRPSSCCKHDNKEVNITMCCASGSTIVVNLLCLFAALFIFTI